MFRGTSEVLIRSGCIGGKVRSNSGAGLPAQDFGSDFNSGFVLLVLRLASASGSISDSAREQRRFKEVSYPSRRIA